MTTNATTNATKTKVAPAGATPKAKAGRREGAGTLQDQTDNLKALLSPAEIKAAEAFVKANSSDVVKLAFKLVPKGPKVVVGLGKRLDDILKKITDVKQREAMRSTLLAAKSS